MKQYLIAAIAATAISAAAQTAIGLHLVSVHDKSGFNNVNPGVYVNHKGLTAGLYHNSEHKPSAYLGYTFSGDLPLSMKWGVTVGAITGYSRHKVEALVVPSIAIKDPLFGGAWRLSYAAKIKKDGAQALHLSHEWSF